MKIYSKSKDKLRFLKYDMISSYLAGIKVHPQVDLDQLGIDYIKAIPESIGDCWMLLSSYEGELPSYIKEHELHIHEPYWQTWNIDIVD